MWSEELMPAVQVAEKFRGGLNRGLFGQTRTEGGVA